MICCAVSRANDEPISPPSGLAIAVQRLVFPTASWREPSVHGSAACTNCRKKCQAPIHFLSHDERGAHNAQLAGPALNGLASQP